MSTAPSPPDSSVDLARWRRIARQLLPIGLLFLALFVAAELLGLSLVPLTYPASPALAQPVDLGAVAQAWTTPGAPPTPSRYDQVQSWGSQLAAGPLLTRSVTISATTATIVLEADLWMPIAHPLTVQAAAGRLDAAFAQAAFGDVSDRGSQSVPQYDMPDWTIDAASGLARIHAHLSFSITADSVVDFTISRSALSEVFTPTTDELRLDLASVQLVSIHPVPGLATSSHVTLTRHQPDQLASVDFFLLLPPVSALSTPAPAKESRQAFMSQLGDVLNIPLVADLLFSLVQALPLLLFLAFIAHSRFGAQSDHPDAIAFAAEMAVPVVSLLVFHFVLYFLSGSGNLSYALPILPTVADRISNAGQALGLQRLPQTLLAAPYRVAPVILGIVVPATLWERLKPDGLGPRPGPVRFLAIAFPAVMCAVALIGTFVILRNRAGLQGIPLGELFLVGACLAALSVWLILIALQRRLAHGRVNLGLLTLAVPVLAAAEIADFYLPTTSGQDNWVSWIWLTVATALGASLLMSVTAVILFQVRRAAPHWTLSRWAEWLLWLLAILLVVPLNRIVPSSDPVYVSDILNLAFPLNDLIVFAWFAGAVWTLRLAGRASPKVGAFSRNLGILAVASIWFSPLARWLFLPITFLVGWFVLARFVQPAEFWDEELAPMLKPVFVERRQLLQRIIELNAALRAFSDLRKKLADKLASGELSLDEYSKKIEAYGSNLEQGERQARIEGRPIRFVALEFGPHPSAWANGLHGAMWGLLFSAPWIILSLRSLLTQPLQAWQSYPLWDLSVDVVTVIVRWLALGFFFGYFYPYLRGKDGLQKGLALFLVATLPSIPILVIYNGDLAAWQGSLFWALQVFIVCLLLGLVAFDYAILRQKYYDWQMLFEVHGLASVGLAASTLLAAIGVAITAALTNQITSLVASALTQVLPHVPPNIPHP